MQSHQAVLLNCALTATMRGRTEHDVVVTALPAPHVYGNVVINGTFLVGGTVVLMERFRPDEALRLIGERGATLFEAVPAMFAMLLADPTLADADQVADFLVPGPDGTVSVRSTPARNVMGQAVVTDTCDTGWVAAWASEMGDGDTLDGILAHADRFMNPTWRDGGLFHPRNDTPTDADGHRTEIEPMTGNVLLGYARLNTADGLWGLYNQPWGPEHHAEPALVEVDRDVEVSQAEVVDGVFRARLRRERTLPGTGTVTLARLADGARLRLGDAELAGRAGGGPVVIDVPDGPAVDLVAVP